MEDIAVDIIRAVFVAILIISVVLRNKRQRMAGKGKESADHPAETPWMPQPQRDMTSAPMPQAGGTPAAQPPRKSRPVQSPAKAKKAVTETVVPPQRIVPAEIGADDAETMAAEYYRSRNAYRPTAAQTAQPIETEAEKSSVDRVDESGFSERFNLRDAVLYSEILKPKFDE